MGRKQTNNKKFGKKQQKKVRPFKINQMKHLRTKKKPWTSQEDELVKQLVQKFGPQKWSYIAKFVPDREGKQCRQRWHNHLNPAILKADWGQNEQWILFLAHTAMGTRWADMTRMFKGRTDNSIKNHWNSTMQKKISYFQQILSDIIQNKRKTYITTFTKNEQYLNLQNQLLDMIFIDKENIRKKISSQKSKISQQNLFASFNKNQSCCEMDKNNTILQNKLFDQQMNSVKTQKNKDFENLFIPLRKENSFTYQPKQNMGTMMMETPPRVNHRTNYSKISQDQNKSVNEIIPQEQSQEQLELPKLSMMNLLSPSNFLVKMQSKKQ